MKWLIPLFMLATILSAINKPLDINPDDVEFFKSQSSDSMMIPITIPLKHQPDPIPSLEIILISQSPMS